MSNLNWIIIGAGELGKEIYHIFFKNSKRRLIYFVDDDDTNKLIYGTKVIKFNKLIKIKKKINYTIAILNNKTRKIGKYIASNIDPLGAKREGTGLSVKGTTIQGFDEKLSIQKTLRKPVDQLKEFKEAGKVKLRKFLDDIPTTDTKLNGRINPDTILLRVN